MIELVEELRNILEDLRVATKFTNDLAYGWTLDSLLENAEAVGKAWCGSWYGYQAYVYYKNFDPPPTGIYFNHKYGFEVDPFGESREESDWSEYPPDAIVSAIEEGIEGSDIKNAIKNTWKCIHEFKNKKGDVLNIIKIAQERNSPFFDDLLDQIEKLEVKTEDEIVAKDRPIKMVTEDPIAVQQGIRTPPHIQFKAQAQWSINAVATVEGLGRLVEKAIEQMERVSRTTTISRPTGSGVFIGHGRSQDWLQLRRLLGEELGLRIVEYNEVAPEGHDILSHLLSSLEQASFAFLVMTGEDNVTLPNGEEKRHPRLNVVHELGLCQAFYGQTRAIALVQKGCEVPSNIIGINHIPFEQGNILSAERKIRKVLQRETII